MRPLVSSFLIVTVGATLACEKSGPSSAEIREFEELERGLGTLAEAPREDRDIRLQEVAGIEVKTERVKKVKDVCVESYRLFGKVTTALDDARSQTQQTETRVEEAKIKKENGGELLHEEEEKLFEMGQSAASALKEVNEALDRAEKAVKSCQDSRQALRQYISDN